MASRIRYFQHKMTNAYCYLLEQVTIHCPEDWQVASEQQRAEDDALFEATHLLLQCSAHMEHVLGHWSPNLCPECIAYCQSQTSELR